MYLLVFATVFATYVCVSGSGAYREPHYYWRNYKGVIPKDAIEGGRNDKRNVTYIGQAASRWVAGVIPGILFSGNPNAIVNYNGRVTFDIYVTILCSKWKHKFVWIPTTRDTMQQLLTDYHLVTGGTEGGSVLYIGRAYQNDELQISKVTPLGLLLFRLNPSTGNVQYVELSFEILAYPLSKIVY